MIYHPYFFALYFATFNLQLNPMKKKFIDYIVTTFTVASAVLLITMLFLDLVHYNADGFGSFVLDTYQLGYFWPSGHAAQSQEILWLAPGLIVAALLLMFPLVLNIFGKKATLFFWGNVGVLATVIAVQFWGLGHTSHKIFTEIHAFPDEEYLMAFYFPYYGLGFSFLAALIYTFYGRSV